MSKEIEVTVDASSQQAEALVGNLKSVPAKWSKWDAGTTYTPLRSVGHNGSGYVCRKACTGVDPEQDVLAGDGVEGECWILTAKKGERGPSGVYIGSGEMPEDCNVQIDPNGEALAGLPCAAEVVDSLPTPGAKLRGKVILVHTNGEDKAYICVLKGGTYHWIGFWGWSGGEAEGSTAVLGVAVLGKMVLGRKEVLGKLDAPVISLVIKTEKLNSPVAYLETVLEQLLAPVIELKEV